LRLFGNIA